MPPKDINAKLAKLNAKKETYFNKIQRLYDLSRDLTNEHNSTTFKIELNTLDTNMNAFQEIIDRINDVSMEINPEYEFNYQPLEMVDMLYCHIREAAKILDNEYLSRNKQQAEQSAVARLQKLDIPEFSGDPKRWPIFFESFKSLVHSSNLDNTSKINYLLGSLKGKALDVCAGVMPTANNYNIIWETLVAKYEDKRLLANTYFNQMMDFKQAQQESYACLNSFLEKFDTAVKAIKQLDIPDLADFIIASIALSKLDTQTRKLFEMSNKNSEIPAYSEIVEFIKMQRKALNSMHKSSFVTSPKQNSSFNSNTKQKNMTFVATDNKKSKPEIQTNKCPICKQMHSIFQCYEFLKLSPYGRYNLARDKRLCLNCLSAIHKIIDCKSTNVCSHCHLRHHSFLHFSKRTSERQENVESPSQSQMDENATENTPVQNFCSTLKKSKPNTNNSTTLLSTAVVNIVLESGEVKPARFLIDSGSQAHIITRKCCQRLKLHFLKCQSVVDGIGGSQNVLGHLNFIFQSRFDSNTQYNAHALVVDKITNNLPTSEIATDSLNYLKHLQLADDHFFKPSYVDGIIGAGLFLHILGGSKVIGPPNLPMALQTSLGYIVMGNIPTATVTENSHIFCTITHPSLDQILNKFWELEEIPSPSVLNKDDIECENIYRSTTTRKPNGRYVVALPFKEYPPVLGNSFDMARRRFHSLENKFKNVPHLKKIYSDIFQDYLEQGHMAFVSLVSENKMDYTANYIPHFAIFKDSVSTPVRIVFDASAKTTNSRSLNDVLYSGPKLQTDIFKILLNFRLFKIAMISDIRQMYRNIEICPEHRKYQRILWRFSVEENLAVYDLTTVVFGITSSPFAALRTIKQLAQDEKNNFPLAAKVVGTDLYVDDLVISIPTISEATELYNQLVVLFSAGGFALVKWVTNSQELSGNIPENMRLAKIVEFEDSEVNSSLKVLGLQWDPVVDVFSFKVNVPNEICTKRNILSTLARIWDPLGFLSAVTLYAKLLIKELWMLKIDWDTAPPSHIIKKWSEFHNEISLLSNFRVPRHIGASYDCRAMLIGFADGSSVGYGAVVFIKIFTPTGNSIINLMCAKSKVAPVKICTIARLELCAAVLLAKLIKSVIDTCSSRIKIDCIYTFSDSTVVLHWIGSAPHRWKTFVANRVTKIQNSLPNAEWFFIESKNNIADCISRGISPARLLTYSEWIHGPCWLRLEKNQWPIQRITSENTAQIPEEKMISAFPVRITEDNPLRILMLRISSWSKLRRIVVYVLRFVRKLPRRKIISSFDLEKAELVLISIVQKIYFGEDFKLLECNNAPSKVLRYLRPFLEDGCIRVGGRLKNANISYSEKHPLLLPKKDHLVNILIDHFHSQYLHTGPHLLLSLIRQRYWILSARNIVRSRIKKCNFCFKFKPKAIFPQMADLPTPRVTETKAFSNCGVDYAGPFLITLSRHRGIKSQKAYLCLFVCLATKAIHLELASDMSTTTFLACFKRFLARRGPVACIYSDCGTNFIGAKAELDQLYSLINSNDYTTAIATELGIHKIEWKFNPPSAPHFGGIWESNIKAVKTHLYKVLGHQILSYEEFSTVLAQIEALLNSRPLCWLSSDPSEPMALTPAHFLTLAPLQWLPAVDQSNKNQNLLSRKELLDQLVQSFWKRWRVEYLSALQIRQKWNSSTCPITKGTLVLIQQENTPPLQWPMGIIEDVFPGKDGIIRVALVRTKNTTYKRPVIKLCPLPNQ